jgi:hypothetical protein
MLQYIFWAIVFYLLFRFIFNFVVPVIRVSRQMRKQMNQFNENMRGQQQAETDFRGQHQQASSQDKPRPRQDDYLDFEEVK